MAALTSNLPTVSRAVMGVTRALSPRRVLPGGRRLGDEYADTIAEAVRHRTADRQQDPDGQPLRPLNAAYRRRKLREGHDGRILVRTGEMLAPQQIRGRVTVTSDTLVMAAGLDEETQQKVKRAHKGSSRRPKRPFYATGGEGKRAVGLVAKEATASAVAEARNL